MKPGSVATVYRKELTDMLRDRRTLVSAILLPLLLFPMLTLGLGGLAIFLALKTTRDTAQVMLLGAEHAPELAARLRREKTFEIVPPADDYVARINNKTLRAAVEIPPGLEASLARKPQETFTVKIYWYEGELRSQAAARAAERIVRAYRDEIVEKRFAERKLSTELLTPFQFERKNAAAAERVTGNIVGLMLPYFLITLCLTGALYPAIDLTAGEKERGTLETLLASPASRGELVAGKFLVVLSASLVTTVLAILSISFTVLIGAELLAQVTTKLVLAVSGKAIAAVLFIVLPLAVVFSAVLLAVAVLARSYREAQTYTTPIIFIVILPAMVSFIPGIELNPRLAFVPIVNVSLASKEVFAGHYPWPLLALIFLSTCFYAALALWFAVRQFKREEVLFRT